jgi:antitoxin ParD1/3/4
MAGAGRVEPVNASAPGGRGFAAANTIDEPQSEGGGCFVFNFEHIEYNCRQEHAMSRTTTLTVRVSGALSDFVAVNVGENGSYENVSEYIRDLIRRDKERAEREAFDQLKAELSHAFAAPEPSYKPLTPAEVIARNRT